MRKALVAALLVAAASLLDVGFANPTKDRVITMAAVRARLTAQESTTILVQGDSTGSAPTRWVHRFTVYLARLHPTLTVRYHGWDTVAQESYLPAQTVQEGTRGVLDVFNASMPGAIISYSSDRSRFREQTPMRHVDVVFINYSHNDSTVHDYNAPFETLAKLDRAKFPSARIAVMTQNPEITPRDEAQIAMQAKHAQQLRALARRDGYDLVDVFRIFAAAMQTHPERYVSADDGEHPTNTGDRLWTRQVIRWFEGVKGEDRQMAVHAVGGAGAMSRQQPVRLGTPHNVPVRPSGCVASSLAARARSL